MSPLFFEQNSSLCCFPRLARGIPRTAVEPRRFPASPADGSRFLGNRCVFAVFSRTSANRARTAQRQTRHASLPVSAVFLAAHDESRENRAGTKEAVLEVCLRDLFAARGEPRDGRVDSVVAGSGMVLCNASFYYY